MKRLIIGMAVGEYNYDPKHSRNAVPQEDFRRFGAVSEFPVDVDTIRDWLREIGGGTSAGLGTRKIAAKPNSVWLNAPRSPNSANCRFLRGKHRSVIRRREAVHVGSVTSPCYRVRPPGRDSGAAWPDSSFQEHVVGRRQEWPFSAALETGPSHHSSGASKKSAR